MANKSYKECIAEVINNSVMSQSEKEITLVKLGVTKHEAKCLAMLPVGALGFNSVRGNYTFGIELETYNVSRARMLDAMAELGLQLTGEYGGYTHEDHTTAYKLVRDGSIQGSMGIECVSPILPEGEQGEASIKKICEALNYAGAKVNKSTGYHVHVGGEITDKQYVNVFKNYRQMQYLINDVVAPSRRNAFYAQCIDRFDFSDCTTPRDVQNKFGGSRYYTVNAQAWSRHRTIEFRQHQGTTDAQKVLMWANFCIKLVAWSADHAFDRYVLTFDDVPFLSEEEKAYFRSRQAHFAGVAA